MPFFTWRPKDRRQMQFRVFITTLEILITELQLFLRKKRSLSFWLSKSKQMNNEACLKWYQASRVNKCHRAAVPNMPTLRHCYIYMTA
jgi:hypothetical protein